jgi:uncharacterized protein YecE (DUF72 family)
MDFGQILDPEKLKKIQWNLPALDSPEEKNQLERLARAGARVAGDCRIEVGASIWSHAPWVGSLYPQGTPSSEFLREYSKQFSTVEINSTFYAIPGADLFQKWNDSVGEHFKFCPKFPKSVSHSLNGDHPDLKIFSDRVALLGNKLGVCFLQFPSHVGPDQRGRLQSLFTKIPRGLKTVVEFRHPAFFQNQRLKPEWVDLLAKAFLGTVSVDTPLEREVAHVSFSSTRVMIRFLGANLHESNEIRLQQWAERIALWSKSGMKEIYFVIHEPDNTHAPVATQGFLKQLNALLMNPLAEPVFHSLF